MGKKGKERKRNQQLREREHAAAVSVKIVDDASKTIESSADTTSNGAGEGGAGSATVLDMLDVTPDELVSVCACYIINAHIHIFLLRSHTSAHVHTHNGPFEHSLKRTMYSQHTTIYSSGSSLVLVRLPRLESLISIVSSALPVNASLEVAHFYCYRVRFP